MSHKYNRRRFEVGDIVLVNRRTPEYIYVEWSSYSPLKVGIVENENGKPNQFIHLKALPSGRFFQTGFYATELIFVGKSDELSK